MLSRGYAKCFGPSVRFLLSIMVSAAAFQLLGAAYPHVAY